MQTALFTAVIHMAMVRMQSTSSSFPAASQVATPAIYSMKPAALVLQPGPSGKELLGEPARNSENKSKILQGMGLPAQ